MYKVRVNVRENSKFDIKDTAKYSKGRVVKNLLLCINLTLFFNSGKCVSLFNGANCFTF